MNTASAVSSTAARFASCLAPWLVGCCACPCAQSAPPASEATAVEPSASAPVNAPLAAAAGSVVAVRTCAGGLKPAADGLVDDLEDGNNRVAVSAGRGGYWWDAKDDLGSSIEPSGELKMFAGGAGASKYAVHVTGKTGAGEKAWGAVVGFSLAEHGLYDASKYAGVAFMAKVGEKTDAKIRLKVADVNTHPNGQVCKEACYNDFGKDFSFTKDWQEYQVSFAELKQQEGWGDPRPPTITPNKLVQIAWHVMTKGVDFDLYLDDVRFLDCK